MEKIKDWFYNYSDIFTGLLITAVAGIVIFGSVTKIMSVSDSFQVLAENKSNSSGPVIYGSTSSGGIDTARSDDDTEGDDLTSGGIQSPTGQTSGSAVTPPASSTPASVTSGGTQAQPPAQTTPDTGTIRNRITIEIPSGSAASTIAKLLYDKGLITDTNDFLSVLAASKLDSKLRSGTFTIPEGSNVTEVINILTGQ